MRLLYFTILYQLLVYRNTYYEREGNDSKKSFWKEEKATIIIFSHVQVEQRDYNQRNIKRMKIIEIELRFHQMLKSQQEKFAIILDINNT